MIKICLFALLCLIVGYLPAQTPSMLLTLGTSANAYKGDLGTFNNWDGSFHFGLQMNKRKRFNTNFGVSYGNITAQSLSFTPTIDNENIKKFVKTTLFTALFDLQYHLLKHPNYMVWIGQGIGITQFTPKDSKENKLIDQNSTRASGESYGTNTLTLPTSLGAMYLFKNGYGVGTVVSLLNTQTPFLDNISKLGGEKGNDNVLMCKIMFVAPLKYLSDTEAEKLFAKPEKKIKEPEEENTDSEEKTQKKTQKQKKEKEEKTEEIEEDTEVAPKKKTRKERKQEEKSE
jgi:hypothetical protein